MELRCAHPLKAFLIGKHPTGKNKYKICSFEVNGLLKISDNDYVCVTDARAKELKKKYNIQYSNLITDFIEIPCGHCIYCRLRYSKNWADRCLLEAQYHKENWFLTLTYDEQHVPTHLVADNDSGEMIEMHSLQLRDLQLFMKRLRKAAAVAGFPKIRFFAAGEYGEERYRPHYHMIAFGLHIPDLQIYKKTDQWIYWQSEWLQSIWQNGNVIIGEADWSAIAYTARYITKKLYGADKILYEEFGLKPEFAVMSRKPGIGEAYMHDHPDMMESSSISVSTFDGGKTFKIPRYFKRKYDKIFEEEDPDGFLEKKERERIESIKSQAAVRGVLLDQTNLSYLELLQVQEEEKNRQIKVLKRGL